MREPQEGRVRERLERVGGELGYENVMLRRSTAGATGAEEEGTEEDIFVELCDMKNRD